MKGALRFGVPHALMVVLIAFVFDDQIQAFLAGILWVLLAGMSELVGIASRIEKRLGVEDPGD